MKDFSEKQFSSHSKRRKSFSEYLQVDSDSIMKETQ